MSPVLLVIDMSLRTKLDVYQMFESRKTDLISYHVPGVALG